MKAHVRKMPTKETYLKNLAGVMEKLTVDISPDLANKLSMKFGSDEYYEKMKKALGGANDE